MCTRMLGVLTPAAAAGESVAHETDVEVEVLPAEREKRVSRLL